MFLLNCLSSNLPSKLLILSLALTVSGSHAASEEGQYLYHGQLSRSEYSPVKIYIATDNVLNAEETSVVLPQFLTSAEDKNRVVEFYAHWCGHCQNYRWHYIDLARSCSSLAKPSYGLDIEFHAISCSANRPICRNQTIGRFPALRIYPAKSGKGIAESVWNAHCFTFLKVFGLEIEDSALPAEQGGKSHFDIDAPKLQNGMGRNNTIRSRIYDGTHYHDTRSRTDILGDAFKSFDFAMRESIYTQDGPLNNETRIVFGDWILMLKQVLPPLWKIQNALDAIAENLKDVGTRERALIEIMDREGPPSSIAWRGCSLDNVANGYTCGLWELFHILTVSVVEWNIAATVPQSVIPVKEIARRLANYIREFFACDVCRSNFLSNFGNCSNDRCNRLGDSRTSEAEWKELALWLWEEHNEVNVRLAKERKELEQSQKEIKLTVEEIEAALWPSLYDCPRCWKKKGKWDKDHVYKYLRFTYWPFDDEKNKTYARYEKEGRSHMIVLSLAFLSVIAAFKCSFRIRTSLSFLRKAAFGKSDKE